MQALSDYRYLDGSRLQSLSYSPNIDYDASISVTMDYFDQFKSFNIFSIEVLVILSSDIKFIKKFMVFWIFSNSFFEFSLSVFSVLFSSFCFLFFIKKLFF